MNRKANSLIAGLLMLALYCQVIALPAGPRAKRTAPPSATPVGLQDTITVYGPQRIDRATPLTNFAAQFALPANAVAPFTLQVQNGAANSGPVLRATIRLNGAVVVTSNELNLQIPSLTQAVSLTANNTLEVSLAGRIGSSITVTITAQRSGGSPPVISGFNPTRGMVGASVTLTGTNLTAGTGSTTVTFAGSNGTRRPAIVTSSSATQVQTMAPNGAATGVVELTTANGTAQTATPFTVDTQQNFQVTIAPTTASAPERSTATQVISVTSDQGNFTQLVTLSVTGLPAGVGIQFQPTNITAGGVSTLSLNLANVALSPGAYPFTVRGAASLDGQSVLRTAPATLNVLAAGQTSVSGRVLSMEQEPVVGATASLDGRTATTDAAGMFLLTGVTAGANRPIMIDGRTANAPNRTYPVITEPATIVANQVNVVPFTFYLPPIDTQFEVPVIPTQNTVVGTPRLDNLALTIPANANLRNRDGSPVTRVSLTPVEIDRTPAPLPANVTPAMVFTAQPGGAVPNPGVRMPVVYPNLTGANPGTQMQLYAFNHDTVQWFVYGLGTVSSDGRTVVPNAGVGLPDFSWHFANPPTPPSIASPDGNPAGNSTDRQTAGECGNKTKTGTPVDLASGMKIEEMTDIAFGGARGGLAVSRRYTSDRARRSVNGRFGRGTKDNYDITLTGTFAANGAGRVVMPDELDGRLFSFLRNDPDGSRVFTTGATTGQLGDVLRRFSNGTFEYRLNSGEAMRFDTSLRLTAMVDRNGNTTTLNYSGNLLTSVTDAVNRSVTFTYNASNFIASATDPLGRTWFYTYQNNLLSQVTDPVGNVMRYAYDGLGQLTTVTDARGSAMKQVTYNAAGRVTQQRYPDNGLETYAYTLSGGRVTGTTMTDPVGRITTMRFDAAGYVMERADGLGQMTRTGRDMNNNLPVSTTGPCGCAEATRQFDPRGNLTQTTDRINNVTRMEYEPVFNHITRVTDPLNRITNLTYDARGNLATVTDALTRATTYAFDQFGQLTTITDPLNHVTRLEYDTAGNVTAVVNAVNNRTQMEYDAIGRLTAVNDPLGRRTMMAYDDLDRIATMTDSAGAVTTYAYDPNSNLISITNALNQRWRRDYDAKDRLIAMVDPLGRVMRREYNAADELIADISPSGRTMRYEYEERGLPKKMTDPLGGIISFMYDNRANLTTLTDERGNITTFTYDELYRPIGRRDPSGQSAVVGYDAVGNVSASFDRLGRRTAYTYDALNRPTRIDYPDAVANYIYDEAYRLTRIDDSQSGNIAWTYDDADRLLTETTPAGVVTYAYNEASQVRTMTAADRPPVNYAFDAAGRLQSITQGAEVFTYAYDTLSRMVLMTRPNGVRTEYTYDTVYRLARLVHANSTSQNLEDFRYTYNADDEIEAITSLASAHRLPATQTVSPADATNRIAQFGPANFTFDNEGQTNTRADAQGTTTYTWDARGRLTRAALPNGQNVDYGYDALGRRSSRTASEATTTFLYNGADIVLDRANIGGTVDYLNGVDIDDKLRQISPATGPLYFLQDHLGSTAALTNSSGAVVETQRYEAFGGNAVSNLSRYGYTGRERDQATGLMYYRARWYDTTQGRFITEDPAGFNATLNFYIYTLNSPVVFSDPLGLDVWVGGSSPSEPGLHQSINIGNPNGTYSSYSFGVSPRMNIWGVLGFKDNSGEVYRDTIQNSERPDYGRYIITTPEEDNLVKGIMEQVVGTKARYNLLLCNCTTFSDIMFNEIRKLLDEKRKPALPPKCSRE